MTVPERIALLVFGLATWSTGMVAPGLSAETLVFVTAPVMAGIGAGLFVTALLPGRTARFS